MQVYLYYSMVLIPGPLQDQLSLKKILNFFSEAIKDA